MLKRTLWTCSFAALLLAPPCRAAEIEPVVVPPTAVRTVVAHEDEKYFFQNGKMDRYEGQNEYTYLVEPEKNRIIRTRVYDYRGKKIRPDETIYTIERQLHSDPYNAARYSLPPVIRAVGRPDPDTVEVLIIRDDSVELSISQNSRLIVAKCSRLR